MPLKDLCKMSENELKEIQIFFLKKGDLKTVNAIENVRNYYHKLVKVVKGRKVPVGTIGECFWLGLYDNSKYGDPWGIYTTTRIGIRDKNGNVFWTSLNNVEII